MFVNWNNSSSNSYWTYNLKWNWNIHEYSSLFVFLEFQESRATCYVSGTDKKGIWWLLRDNFCLFLHKLMCGYSVESLYLINICFYGKLTKVILEISSNTACILWTSYLIAKPHCSNFSNCFGRTLTCYDVWASSWDYGTYNIGDQRRLGKVSPEPSLFAHMKYGSRRSVQPKIRQLVPLDSCACAFEEWVYGGRKVP